jgi:hypothetical protein
LIRSADRIKLRFVKLSAGISLAVFEVNPGDAGFVEFETDDFY